MLMSFDITKKVFLLIALVPVLLACTSNESTASSTSLEKKVETQKSAKLSGPVSPCELVPVDVVRAMFAVADDIQIEMKDRVLTYPTCSFEWEDGKVVHTMQAGTNELHINMPSEVMIVMVKDAVESMYNTSIQVYKDIETVDNIGEMASWGAKMAQLTFLSNHYMFHVHVRTSNDNEENKAKASEVAKLIIGKL